MGKRFAKIKDPDQVALTGMSINRDLQLCEKLAAPYWCPRNANSEAHWEHV